MRTGWQRVHKAIPLRSQGGRCVVQSGDAAVIKAVPDAAHAIVDLQGLKVMVVDDSNTIRRGAELFLSKAGCQVYLARYT